jgi:hypothetical protein
MERKPLDEFVDRILPFYGLWQSVRVSGAAVNVNGGWFNVALQLEVREEKPEARVSFLVPPDFLHFRFEYPICELRNLISDTIQNGFFALGADGNPQTNSGYFYPEMPRTRQKPQRVWHGLVRGSFELV